MHFHGEFPCALPLFLTLLTTPLSGSEKIILKLPLLPPLRLPGKLSSHCCCFFKYKKHQRPRSDIYTTSFRFLPCIVNSFRLSQAFLLSLCLTILHYAFCLFVICISSLSTSFIFRLLYFPASEVFVGRLRGEDFGKMLGVCG